VTKCESYPDKVVNSLYIWIGFLRHRIHELQTFKNGPVFMA